MGYRFKALGDDTRRKILSILGNKENATAGEISKNFKLSQPTISSHLKILKESGLIKERKHKQNRIYSINKANMQKVIKTLEKIVN